jgi:hypothetical protein
MMKRKDVVAPTAQDKGGQREIHSVLSPVWCGLLVVEEITLSE